MNNFATSKQPVYIETNGFLLRTLTPADVTPDFVKWINSPELLAGLNLPALGFTKEKLAQFIASFDNLHNYFVGIFVPKTNQMIGFYTMDVNLIHKNGNITTGIGESAFEGKGVLWATIDALLDHFFIYRDLFKVTARILSSNRRMIFNFVNNTRFAFEARMYKECLGQDGKRKDLLVFAAFKDLEDLEKARSLVR